MKPVPTPNTSMFFQTAQWILNPLGYMTTNAKRFGDIFEANVFWGVKKPFSLVYEPKALQFLLTHDTGKELSAPGDLNRIVEPLLGKHNLMMLDGEQHRNRRQLMMPPLHGERLQAYGEIIQDVTRRVLEQWQDNTTLDVRSVMQTITLKVILQVIFGLRKGERYEQLEQILRIRMELMSTLGASILTFVPKLQDSLKSWKRVANSIRLAEETDKLLFAEIQERRTNSESDPIDVLSLLLAAKDEQGNGLTDQELRDELLTLLVAGHDTTATALTWAIYWTLALPEVKQKLGAELAAVHSTLNPNTLINLPYLSAVCNETLRIYPPAIITFPRQVEMPLELAGCRLEPGMLVLGCIYLLHHREDIYPNAHLFKPERFLERLFSPYEFMPFGGGVRRCIGSAFALYEMKIILGTIFSEADLALTNKRQVQPRRRGVNVGQTPVLIQKLGLTSSPREVLPV